MDGKETRGASSRKVIEARFSAATFDRQSSEQQLAMHKLVFDSIYNGAVVTDADDYIILFNKPYGDFLGVDPEAQIGKHPWKWSRTAGCISWPRPERRRSTSPTS